MNGLVVEGLDVRYGHGKNVFHALENINLVSGPGTFVTLLGPSGSGKTTLLRSIAGLVQPSRGKIAVNGTTFYDDSAGLNVPTRSRNLGMVFQAFALWPHMSVEQNIAYALKLRKWAPDDRRKRVSELLQLVGLDGLGQRLPSQLSGGQQQRVGIARAVAYKPSVLLMDEPLSGLDARLREEMRSYIGRLHRELGITIVYVTHDRQEALALSDTIVVLSAGSVVAAGSPQMLYGSPPDAFTASFLANWSRIGQLDEIAETIDGGWIKQVYRPAPCECGGRCQLLLPGDLEEMPRGGPAAATVKARVANAEFLGSAVRLEIQIPGVQRSVFISRPAGWEESNSAASNGSISLSLRSFRLLCERQDTVGSKVMAEAK